MSGSRLALCIILTVALLSYRCVAAVTSIADDIDVAEISGQRLPKQLNVLEDDLTGRLVEDIIPAVFVEDDAISVVDNNLPELAGQPSTLVPSTLVPSVIRASTQRSDVQPQPDWVPIFPEASESSTVRRRPITEYYFASSSTGPPSSLPRQTSTPSFLSSSKSPATSTPPLSNRPLSLPAAGVSLRPAVASSLTPSPVAAWWCRVTLQSVGGYCRRGSTLAVFTRRPTDGDTGDGDWAVYKQVTMPVAVAASLDSQPRPSDVRLSPRLYTHWVGADGRTVIPAVPTTTQSVLAGSSRRGRPSRRRPSPSIALSERLAAAAAAVSSGGVVTSGGTQKDNDWTPTTGVTGMVDDSTTEHAVSTRTGGSTASTSSLATDDGNRTDGIEFSSVSTEARDKSPLSTSPSTFTRQSSLSDLGTTLATKLFSEVAAESSSTGTTETPRIASSTQAVTRNSSVSGSVINDSRDSDTEFPSSKLDNDFIKTQSSSTAGTTTQHDRSHSRTSSTNLSAHNAGVVSHTTSSTLSLFPVNTETSGSIITQFPAVQTKEEGLPSSSSTEGSGVTTNVVPDGVQGLDTNQTPTPLPTDSVEVSSGGGSGYSVDTSTEETSGVTSTTHQMFPAATTPRVDTNASIPSTTSTTSTTTTTSITTTNFTTTVQSTSAVPSSTAGSTVATSTASTSAPVTGTSSTLAPSGAVTSRPGVVVATGSRAYVQLELAVSADRFCQVRPLLTRQLSRLLQRHANYSESSANKIVLFNVPLCPVSESSGAVRPSSVNITDNSVPSREANTGVLASAFVVDMHAHANNPATRSLARLWHNANHSSNTAWPSWVSSVSLVDDLSVAAAGDEAEVAGWTSRPALVAAVAVIGAAVACLALLLLLLLLRRRGQLRSGAGGGARRQCQPVVALDDYTIDSVFSSLRRKTKLQRASSGRSSYLNAAFRGDSEAATGGRYQSTASTPSNIVNFNGLANLASDLSALKDEFDSLPVVGMPSLDEMPAGAEEFNRYANVLPTPATRVVLKHSHGLCASDYINANYIRGPKLEPRYYIATQAPLESTIGDFWRMVWETQARTVVCLTDVVERGVRRCAEYLPPSDAVDRHRLYGDFQVTLTNRQRLPHYTVCQLQLKSMETDVYRDVVHLWYSGWPERGVPAEPAHLVQFVLHVRRVSLDSAAPLVVHCSPGTGRTGVWLACDMCMRQYDSPARSVDVVGTVCRLRHDRAGCVQTREQYALIYKVLNHYATAVANGNLPILKQ